MAQLLPPQPNSERISQLLPTVKCSTCNKPVPLSDLGDHVCSAGPSSTTLPSALRTSSPFQRKPSPLSRGDPDTVPPAQPGHPRNTSVSANRPSQLSIENGARVRALSNANNAQNPPSPTGVAASQSPPLLSSPSPVQAPTRTTSYSALQKHPQTPTDSASARIPFPTQRDATSPGPENVQHHPSLSINRASPRPVPPALRPMRTNLSPSPSHVSQSSVASAIRSRYTNNTLSSDHNLPRPDRAPSTPHFSEGNIDTSSGGEAGMAGVGRRGFAAVARAAMFTTNYPKRLDPPSLLDIDATRAGTETPPLSAGSSHSAGLPSPFPQTPLTPDSIITRSPSPGQFPFAMPLPGFPDIPVTPTTPNQSPLSRLPFFEKFKNKMPGANVVVSQDIIYETGPSPNTAIPETPSTAVPLNRIRGDSANSRHSPLPPSEADTASRYAPSPPSRTISLDTTTSRTLNGSGRPQSPGTDSEGGLAYADSDGEETDYSSRSRSSAKEKSTPFPGSILRSGSIASTAHVRFPSTETTTTMRTHHRDTSAHDSKAVEHPTKDRNSTTSSRSSARGRKRTNSSLVAQALGLSGTPPKDYGKLGGPGTTGFGERKGRSTSASSSGSARSTSAHDSDRARKPSESGASLVKSKSAGYQRTDARERDGNNGPPPPSPGAKTQRSNTVQMPHSPPETRMVKLPTRSRTSPMVDRGKQLDSDGDRDKLGKAGDRAKKIRVCLKCGKMINDGRWVHCDGGGVLCDLCWKSLYLPKCRRCDLPIEKQAVSSSDGQLKGKYHRECFNCHVCHEPFPDRTFYVFDGKPLCAYHYHEANKSLCSAAHCGQPIEGPCALSHTGDRYHPEHLTCEYPGYPKCSEKLVEYWEVDGRMFCERHATGHGKGVDQDDQWNGGNRKNSNAKKRVTRFIDLANGVEGSDLR
ncbi:hypothetical protein AX15_007739 [Amanita polypyramis BW_CC]|nr:hypothetical protein AX15_007739 [Amanita polypyramis BW_CC]